MAKKSNEEVLKEVKEKRRLVAEMDKRKVKFVGHILRYNSFLGNIMEEKILGQKRRGQPRKKYLDDIKNIVGFETYEELKRAAMEGGIWLGRQGMPLEDDDDDILNILYQVLSEVSINLINNY